MTLKLERINKALWKSQCNSLTQDGNAMIDTVCVMFEVRISKQTIDIPKKKQVLFQFLPTGSMIHI